MGWLSRRFTSAPRDRRTTVDRPFRIVRPAIGFLDLLGAEGAALADADRAALALLFADVRSSTSAVPECAVLFVYCTLYANGKVAGTRSAFAT